MGAETEQAAAKPAPAAAPEAAPGSLEERGAVLALGFGTAVAMWALGYVGRLPFVLAPGWLLALGFLLALVGGGFLAGRLSLRPLRTALLAGATAFAVDLLVLGSLLREASDTAVLWLPACLAGFALLAGLGALVGRATRPADPGPRDWTTGLAAVATSATLLLLMAGGLVTGFEAGLAVPDWPNTYRSNMFLYPLSRMTGGIYYEHAHRLFGALVGLTTIVVAVHTWRVERRRWVRRLAAGLVPLVVLQGVLGGLRVTGKLTLETEGLNPRTELAIVHGALAQVFFALLLVLVAALSGPWRRAPDPSPHPAAASDRALGGWVIALVALQLLLGAVVRHTGEGVTWHIANAVAVVGLGIAAGVRAWGLYPDRPVLPRLGAGLALLVGIQLVFGFAALAASYAEGPDGGPHALDVPLTTLHQTTGAVILSLAVQVRVWHQRLNLPIPEDAEG